MWVYDKRVDGPPAFRHVAHTLTERKLYSLETKHPKGLSLEQQFAVIEGTANKILERLDHSGSLLSEQEVVDLMYFMALSHFRVPRQIEHTRELATALVAHQLKDLANDEVRVAAFVEEFRTRRGASLTVNQVQQAAAAYEGRFTVDRQSALAQSLNMAETTAEALRGLVWQAVRVEEAPFFITSDSPLCALVQGTDGKAIFGGGFGLEALQVTFPISPRTCLFGDRLGAKSPSVQIINKRTAWNALRYIVVQTPSEALERIIDEARATASLPKLDRDDVARLHEESKAAVAASTRRSAPKTKRSR